MCDCITKFDKLLEQFNTRIKVPFWSSSGLLTPNIETCKVDDKKRGKPRCVSATYCPFCGVKYKTAKASESFHDIG